MRTLSLSPEEVSRRAKEIYDRDIRAKVGTPRNKGKLLVLDIESGDYEICKKRFEDDLKVDERLRARHPNGIFFGLRIGYRAADKIGRSWKDLEE
jgi:hypothetical protein